MEFFVNPRGVVIKGKGPNAATTDRKYLFTTKGKRLTIVRYDKGESVTVFVGKVANKTAYNAYAANESAQAYRRRSKQPGARSHLGDCKPLAGWAAWTGTGLCVSEAAERNRGQRGR